MGVQAEEKLKIRGPGCGLDPLPFPASVGAREAAWGGRPVRLSGAALADCGVPDMLRFHKHTVGWAWVYEYGSPDDPEMFKGLRAYSPLHNVKPATEYPATLITMTAWSRATVSSSRRVCRPPTH